jgi:hypothetical protein
VEPGTVDVLGAVGACVTVFVFGDESRDRVRLGAWLTGGVVGVRTGGAGFV